MINYFFVTGYIYTMNGYKLVVHGITGIGNEVTTL